MTPGGSQENHENTFTLEQSRAAVPQSTIKLVNKKQILAGVVDNVLELFFTQHYVYYMH